RRRDLPGPVVNTRTVDGLRVQLATIQSVEARAHRFSESLREALSSAGIRVPLIELYRQHSPGNSWADLLTDSYQANHRVSDAAWREACDPGDPETKGPWPRFWDARGSVIDPRKPIGASDLLRLYPQPRS